MKNGAIVVLNYNGAEVLKTFLPSVIQHSVLDCWVIDNASTDGTRRIVRELCDRDQRWRYLRFSRDFGVETSMAVGLRSARGDAAMVVLHLGLDMSRLQAVQQLLQEAGLNTPVVVRVDRHELELAVEASRCGAVAVLASNDVRPASWLRLHMPSPGKPGPGVSGRSFRP